MTTATNLDCKTVDDAGIIRVMLENIVFHRLEVGRSLIGLRHDTIVQVLTVQRRREIDSTLGLGVCELRVNIVKDMEMQEQDRLFPSTIALRPNILMRSLRTSGPQVAERAMMGTRGKIFRRMCISL